MKNILKNASFAVILAALLSVSGFAQHTLTSTTLSSDLDKTQNVFSVAGAPTGTAAGWFAFVNREAMKITAVSSNTITVIRGVSGTQALKHTSGDTIYIDQAQYFGMSQIPSGKCAVTDPLAVPMIDVKTGAQYKCLGSVWQVSDGLSRYAFSMSPGAQPSAAAPAAGSASGITAQTGGASTAAGTAGGAGGVVTVSSGAGGAGASTGTAGAGGETDVLSGAGGAAAGAGGTGGAGGLVKILAGNGGGTITGGAGGAVTITAGNGANGSTAGGSGGNVTLKAGAVGTGGTGSAGVIRFADSADGTKLVKLTLSGITTGTTRNWTAPDADITLSGIQAQICGTTSTCSATNTPTLKIATGNAPLVSGTPSTVAVTGISPAFTGTTTFGCSASLEGTTAAQAAMGVAVSKVSGSAVTFTSANTQTLVVDYFCAGT